MGLDVFFLNDVTARLAALDQANDAALTVAGRYGMNTEVAKLCREVYAGALADVGAAFGLPQTVVIVPMRGTAPKKVAVQRWGSDPRGWM